MPFKIYYPFDRLENGLEIKVYSGLEARDEEELLHLSIKAIGTKKITDDSYICIDF